MILWLAAQQEATGRESSYLVPEAQYGSWNVLSGQAKPSRITAARVRPTASTPSLSWTIRVGRFASPATSAAASTISAVGHGSIAAHRLRVPPRSAVYPARLS